MTVAELLARISSRELSEWLCYFDLVGPPGEERADWRAGMVASVIANGNRDPKRQKKAYQARDFMLRWGHDEAQTSTETPPPQSVEQQIGLARKLARALGGEITVG